MEFLCALDPLHLELPQRSHIFRMKQAYSVISVRGWLMTLHVDFASQDYFRNPGAAIGTVRRQGGEGLIAEIVRVEKDGGQISPDEIVAMVFLLLLAGHETTTHLISGSTHELLKILTSVTGSKKTGAASIWPWRSFCGLSHRCSSPNRATCGRILNSAASG
jgi:hypothetical protein